MITVQPESAFLNQKQSAATDTLGRITIMSESQYPNTTLWRCSAKVKLMTKVASSAEILEAMD